jgi:hypothetical protein
MSRQHYVSRFHLSAFCDPASTGTPDPWLWVGSTTDQSVRRRSPKNVAAVPGFFDGPGGFSEPGASLETFLANDVEGPAATALRRLLQSTLIEQLPPEVMRYLAWAASRSLPMQRLEADWATRYRPTLNGPMAEPPPPALAALQPRHRSIRLIHPVLGERRELSSEAVDEFLDDGWIPDSTEQSNFLEGVHIQAYYFQVRWFPRLRWFTLRPPQGQYFVIWDRPVGWGVPECLDAPPSCLRDEAAFLIAPLSRSLALVGRNDSTPWAVTPSQVNALLAAWSLDWIAGPTADVVADALSDRRGAVKSDAI